MIGKLPSPSYSKWLFTIAILFLLVGCNKEDSIQDWRHGEDTCTVHGGKMLTAVVPRFAGACLLFSRDYNTAKSKEFPNCGIEYGPDMYGKERGLIFICPECETARRRWKPEEKK